ncbi:unnamed protein product [Owenia fusiformis]|uniref:Uncharacterized protein n=1 Tax=Owenia fusiformis TaxID=6347 RepID=A0A8S4PQW6_OWEFU|nr:unnamed protein product [Owenia fusiformis]
MWMCIILFLVLDERKGDLIAASEVPHPHNLTNSVFLSNETRLLSKLFYESGYNRNALPKRNAKDSVEVAIKFYISQIDALREKDQVLTVTGWVESHWRDEFITWNPEDYGGIEYINVLPELVWLPRWALFSSPGDIFKREYFELFQVRYLSDGAANIDIGGDFSTVCPVNIKFYPFDDQICKFIFANWVYTGNDVNLTCMEPHVNLEVFLESGEWEIIETNGKRIEYFYAAHPDLPYPEVHYTIVLRRKPLFYMINVVLPVMLIACLTLLVFWLPADSGEKMSMGLTILLSFSVFLLLIVDNIPKTSTATPLIVVFLVTLMSITTMSVGFTVMVLHIHFYGHPELHPPKWLIKLVSTVHKSQILHQDTSEVYYNSKEDEQNCNNIQDSVIMTSTNNKHQNGQNTFLSNKVGELIEKVVKRQEKHDDMKLKLEKWRAVARGIDRLLFWICLSLLVIFAVIFLGIYPNTKPDLREMS